MRFKIGDSVKVKKGILCPGDDTVCIGGWQGRIIDIDDNNIGICWDSLTLKQMPLEYIRECEKEGLGWAEMYLHDDEIEPASPRDSATDTKQLIDKMESQFHWLESDDPENVRIYKVIADADDPDEAWNEYLIKALVFPFEAEVSEPQDHGPLDNGDIIQVNGIDEVDDLYGVLVKVTEGRRRFVFPLCDLEVTDKKSPNYIPVNDYCVWFANR
ncbi:MAG TPA: hypothetical protein ENN86_03725 [Desulfobacteraceae bacterium]|nr:hypothetical protein [Desulfobacteraceae bacterium]